LQEFAKCKRCSFPDWSVSEEKKEVFVILPPRQFSLFKVLDHHLAALVSLGRFVADARLARTVKRPSFLVPGIGEELAGAGDVGVESLALQLASRYFILVSIFKNLFSFSVTVTL
jgi:hypothetical protein